MLDAVAQARAKRAGVGEIAPPVRAPEPRDTDKPNYWSVVFDVVTPAAWERLVEAAMSQARCGDPRYED